MRQRPRLRRVLKWGGLATCVLILELLGINVFRGTIWVSGSTDPSSDASFVFYLQDGSVITGVWEKLPPSPVPSHTLFHRWGGGAGSGGSIWRPGFDRWVVYLGRQEWRCDVVIIPLLLYLLLVLGLTALLWYPDYRAWRALPPGRCQKCGYDLTGNESGRCPECGTEVPVERQKGSEV